MGERDIFVALPMTAGGVPYIVRYPISEGGLAQALEVLKKRKHEVLSSLEAQALYKPPASQPQVRLDKHRERVKSETTESQRANALALIEKLGLKR
jgi:hypothetical protein